MIINVYKKFFAYFVKESYRAFQANAEGKLSNITTNLYFFICCSVASAAIAIPFFIVLTLLINFPLATITIVLIIFGIPIIEQLRKVYDFFILGIEKESKPYYDKNTEFNGKE